MPVPVAELSIPAEVTVEGVSYPSFEAARDAGYPFACEAFALCENAATVALRHPVLTAVPACDRCAEKIARLS